MAGKKTSTALLYEWDNEKIEKIKERKQTLNKSPSFTQLHKNSIDTNYL